MSRKYLSISGILIFFAILFMLYRWVTFADRTREENAFGIGVQGYIFGYPLVVMDATKTAFFKGKEGPQEKYLNAFVHSTELASPDFRLVASPNVDTLYSHAWLDLSKGPLLLHIPETVGRYYVLELLDGWTNVIADPGTRTIGPHAKDYIIIGPNWDGQIPAHVTAIKVPTNMAWIILRIECTGPADLSTVQSIQKAFSLKQLEGTDHFALNLQDPYSPLPSPASTVEHMNAYEFFGTMARLLIANPPASADAPIISKLGSIGIFPGISFEKKELDPAVYRGLQKAIPVAQTRIQATANAKGKIVNGWTLFSAKIGTYGTDYLLRACITSWGLGVNLPEDAIYPFTYVDSDGNPLNGAHTYRIHFAKGETPPVYAFWSITMYGADHFLVANPIHRYAIQSHKPLHYNDDGSCDLIIQRDQPTQHPENWLPSPEGDFNLILRMYWPKSEALDGIWTPPHVEKI